DEIDLRVAAATLGEHPGGDVTGDHLGAVPGECHRRRAGSRREVEDALTWSGGHGIGDGASPRAGETEGEDIVREVVAGGDIIEHRGDVVGLLVQLGTVHVLIVSTPQRRRRIRHRPDGPPRMWKWTHSPSSRARTGPLGSRTGQSRAGAGGGERMRTGELV